MPLSASAQRRALLSTVALVSFSGAADPAIAGGSQPIDVTVPLICRDFGGTTTVRPQLRITADVIATTSPGELVMPRNVKATLSLSAESQPFVVGYLKRISLKLTGGTITDELSILETEAPFKPVPAVNGVWNIPLPVSGLASPYLQPFRTATTADTLLAFSSLEIWTNPTANADATPFQPSPHLCGPQAGSGHIATIPNDPTAPARPTVTSISPAVGGVPGGTTVTIKGTNFVEGAAPHVEFAMREATDVVRVDDTTLTAKTPPADWFGPVGVAVHIGNRMIADPYATQFDYQSPELAPHVTSMTPSFGPVGTIVTVKGRNFEEWNTTEFGWHYNVISEIAPGATEFQFTIPEGEAPGEKRLELTNMFGRSADTPGDDFTVTAPPVMPTMKSLTPATAKADLGNIHLMGGANFANVAYVQVGKKRVRPRFVINAGRALIFISPPQPAGSYPVTLVARDGRLTPADPARTITYR